LLEIVYEKALMHELSKAGLEAQEQVPIDLIYDGESMGLALRADIVVENAIVLELKSVEKLNPVFSKQLYTYLKVMDKRLGFLVNFSANNITYLYDRVVNRFVNEEINNKVE